MVWTGKPKDEIAQAMQRIISIAKQAGQWNYLINFQSDTVLPEIECPQNVGIGIDVRSQDDLRKAIVNLKSVRTGVRYVRSRPMAKLDFSIFEEEGLEIHWLVLGLNDGEKASLEYAADAYDQARKVGIPIYCLDDLVIRPTEHPVVEVDLAA